MLVSFILPCYNVGKYIADCLDSIYTQDIPEERYEVICVNDCSSDNTHEVIASIQRKHSNLLLLDQPRNMYSGAARNRGLEVAKGDYIWFVDADDKIKPNVLSFLLNTAYSDDLDILLFNYDEFKDGSEDIMGHGDIFRDSQVMSGNEFVEKEFNCHLSQLSLLWLRLVKRSFIEKNDIRFPDLYISQDCPFAWEALLLADRVKSIHDRCYLYRSSAGSITANKNTAKKAAVWSFQFPYELKKVERKVEGRVSEDIIQDLERGIRHEVNQFAVRYNRLPSTEKPQYFASMRSCDGWYRQFRSYLSRKNRMLYLSSALGERMFCFVAGRFADN